MKHRNWIILAGVLWFTIGAMLLYKGTRFVIQAIYGESFYPFCADTFFDKKGENGVFLIMSGLLIGFIKGRLVFKKTVQRMLIRLFSFPSPVSWTKAYSPAYWATLLGMMGLGFCLRYVPIPLDLRGALDIAIGSALIQGAFFYFQATRYKRTEEIHL